MKTYQMLEKVKKELCEVGICEDAEAEWLVALALCEKRSESHSQKELSKRQERRIEKFLKQRKKHKPLAYVTKSAEFFGFDFFVNKNVLIPRPETEELVDMIQKQINDQTKLLDIGTGSGAIAITLQKLTNAEVVAVDISKKAIFVAKKNAKKLDAKVDFVCSNLFENLQGQVFDVIVSNPPYVSESEFLTLEKDVKDFEPKLALVAENDGMKIYEEIIKEAPKYLTKNGKIFFEIGHTQAERMEKLLEKDFGNITIKKDLEGKDRMVFAVKKGD